MRDNMTRWEMESDLIKWCYIPRTTFIKCSRQAIELMHTAVSSAMIGLRDATLPNIKSACDIIELGDQRLLAGDGPAGGQPPDISLQEWRIMYKRLSAARRVLEKVGQ